MTIGLARTVYEIQRIIVPKIWSGGATPPGYPRGKFLHDARDSVEAHMHAKYELLALIVSEILKIFENWGPRTPLGGHRRGSKVVPLDSQEGVFY